MSEKKWSAIEIYTESLMSINGIVYKFDKKDKVYIPLTSNINKLSFYPL